MNQDNVKFLVDEFYFAAEDTSATLDDRMHAVEYIINQEMQNAQPGMTEGWHVVDVLSHLLERLGKATRGRLSRYGNSGEVRR